MTTTGEPLASAADVTVKELRYGVGPINTMDLYTASQSAGPENAAPTRNVLVYVRGGAWRSGDKSEYKDLASKLVAASPSLEVAVVNYVLSPRKPEDGPAVRHPTHAADVLRALHCLIDPSSDEALGTRSSSLPSETNLWLVGHSCGAHILSSIFLRPPEDSPSSSLTPSPELIGSVKGIMLAEGIYDIDLLLSLHPTYGDFVEGAFTARFSYTDVSTPNFTTREGTGHIQWIVVHSAGDSLINEEESLAMYDALVKLYSGTANVSKDFSFTEDHFEVLHTEAFHDLLLRFSGRGESKKILSEDDLPPVASIKEAAVAALLPNASNILS
ncbi:Kynurenine formamidase [Tulasnella sp. 417]|nr:Kynurenine formamidase [Tulasnella sp. 417]